MTATRADSGGGANARFAAALLDPDLAVPQGVTGPDGAVAQRRYGVYRNNVVTGLVEALKSAFPSVLAILGEDNFVQVARNFIAMHPPRSPMMQLYGDAFPAFVEGFPPLRRVAYLGDVARVERAFLDAWHAADAPCLSPSELAGIEPENVHSLVFRPHPALHLIHSTRSAFDLFCWRDGRPEAGTDPGRPQCVLVTRPALQVEVREITAQQHEFLSLLAAGEAFGAASEQMLAGDPGFEIAAIFSLALGAGAFLPLNQTSEA